MTPKAIDVSLSELQLAVMRVLWERGECTTAEVVEGLDRSLAHTTVATLLTRLEKRGVVGARRDGRQISYQARVEESDVKRTMVAGLLESLFGGDAKALVAHLVSEEEIAPGDLEKVRRLIAKTGDAR